ncbi:MAG TPA: biotin/lipoyl-containing protein [Clostridia bacterium]|nr:biotin/lipoyl-containing protein [Clostridia bacterium]
MSEEEMMAVPDTVGSSLWLSLVDMLVVFAVLAFLMVVCYVLRFLTRGSLAEVSIRDSEEAQVDVAAGDEPASEVPMMRSASHATEDSGRLPAAPAMVTSGYTALATQPRVYKMTVNGKMFSVGIEQMNDVQSGSPEAAVSAPITQVPGTAAPASPVAARSAAAHSPGVSSNLMKSPLPGKILKVFAARGKAFARGDTLIVIEAMKMENEILAPRDCVVAEVDVDVNQSVKTGEPLLRME